jgi:hypothetical protein
MTARVRDALVLALLAAVGLLAPSLVAPSNASSAVLLVAVTAIVTASWRLDGHVGWLTARLLPPRLRASVEVRCSPTGRATDPVHSPLRPRAPGLV